jgi:hypothetical protein
MLTELLLSFSPKSPLFFYLTEMETMELKFKSLHDIELRVVNKALGSDCISAIFLLKSDSIKKFCEYRIHTTSRAINIMVGRADLYIYKNRQIR